MKKVKSVLTDAAGVEVRPVPDVYPMGWERVLVREVLHKEYGGYLQKRVLSLEMLQLPSRLRKPLKKEKPSHKRI